MTDDTRAALRRAITEAEQALDALTARPLADQMEAAAEVYAARRRLGTTDAARLRHEAQARSQSAADALSALFAPDDHALVDALVDDDDESTPTPDTAALGDPLAALLG
ncbi:hypothetical protein [Nocardioides conyzicola]|uniref:Uncharacterized protein n=1 Tax=Nocardioides conyzicola TaxID=1651781 RepID=A0ABP8X0D7_9ACTN